MWGVMRRLQDFDNRAIERNRRRPLSRLERWLLRYRTAAIVASVLVTAAPLIAGIIFSGNNSTMPTWFLFLIPLQVGGFTYLITRTLQARADAQAQGEGS